MRKHTLSLLLLAVAAVPLGGCSLFGKANNFAAKTSPAKQLKAEDFAQARLTAGRDALGKSNWAEAIMAFRDARSLPALAGQAHNGTGVAYAELGRPDIAERYFLAAIAAAPGDRRFAANLAKLYARNAQPEPALAAAPAPIPALTPQRSALTSSNPAIRVERPSGRLVRTARGEMQLQSLPTGANDTQMASAAAAANAPAPGVSFTRRGARPQ